MADKLPYQDLVVREIEQQADQRARAMAAELGAPAGYQPLSDRQELEYWMREDPSIDVQALLAQGTPIEEVTKAKHPDRVRLIEMGRPKWTDRVEYAEKMAQNALMHGAEKSDRLEQIKQGIGGVQIVGPGEASHGS